MLSTLVWLIVYLLIVGAVYWICTLLLKGKAVTVAAIICGLFALIGIIYALSSLLGSGTSIDALAAVLG